MRRRPWTAVAGNRPADIYNQIFLTDYRIIPAITVPDDSNDASGPDIRGRAPDEPVHGCLYNGQRWNGYRWWADCLRQRHPASEHLALAT
jgi:hypothetical protein